MAGSYPSKISTTTVRRATSDVHGDKHPASHSCSVVIEQKTVIYACQTYGLPLEKASPVSRSSSAFTEFAVVVLSNV